MTAVGEGMLLLDKPEGPTSHDVVAAIRRTAGITRVGHTGTLDPPASGLLVLLLGRATRLATYLPSAPKSYVGTLRLGVSTLTDDLAGEVLSRYASALPSGELVHDAAVRLRESTSQVPPAVSARHVGGRRMHRAARRGVVLEAPASRIEVERLDLLPTPDPATWSFETSVSSGTYVRGLVRDLGALLGCGAAVASLRRTRIGPLRVEDALGERDARDVETLAQSVVPLDAVPLAAPGVVLAGPRAVWFRQGRRIEIEAEVVPDGVVAVRDETGTLLGIASAGSGILRPRMVLPPSEPVDARDGAVIRSGRSSS